MKVKGKALERRPFGLVFFDGSTVRSLSILSKEAEKKNVQSAQQVIGPTGLDRLLVTLATHEVPCRPQRRE